jgi:hypothetical protein
MESNATEESFDENRFVIISSAVVSFFDEEVESEMVAGFEIVLVSSINDKNKLVSSGACLFIVKEVEYERVMIFDEVVSAFVDNSFVFNSFMVVSIFEVRFEKALV